MTLLEGHAGATDPLVTYTVRDPLAVPQAVLAARRRPMSERLELALSWNAVASELRAGLLKMKRAAGRPQDLADVRLLESLDDAP